MKHRFLALFACLATSALCLATNGDADLRNKPVRLVANDWCPQHCASGKPGRGFIVDVVDAALRLEKIPYSLEFRPWLRAMAETESGKFDGLLTPTVDSYPQFNYHQEAVGYQEYCLYSRLDTNWQYRSFNDLYGKRLAFLKDSGFGALDDFLVANRERINVYEFPDSGDYAQRLFSFLEKDRADVVIITSDVFQFETQQGTIPRQFRTVGCLGPEKLSIGLTKADPTRSKLIGNALDRGLKTLRKTGQMQKLLARYGISNR